MKEIKQLKITLERKRVEGDLLGEKAETPDHVYHLFKEMENEVREKLVCLHLTEDYRVISFEVVAIGTASQVLADPLEILRGAIIMNAAKIVVIHNHPSASPEPSESDIRNAKALKEKARVVGIELSDELIIGDGGYVSLGKRDLL